MAMNHQISSNVYDRYHGAVNAKELYSQKQHGHGDMRVESGKGDSRSGPQVQDGFYKDFKPSGNNSGAHQRYDGIDGHGHSRDFDRYDFAGHNSHWRDPGYFLYEKQKNGLHSMHGGVHGAFYGTIQSFKLTKITVTHSAVFSGMYLGSLEKANEAHQNFLKAALGYIKNPSEHAYKSLNDAMIKLMDPRFAPAITGGAAKVTIRNVNGITMARFTMEVTPAPTKTLEEAREDLRNAYSSRRDGEKDIAGIRAEAYTNYIRALSEKFKKDGVISHTNNTPTTPVFKSSVVYIVRVAQINVSSLREIRRPVFGHNLYGRLAFKDQHGFWNDYRQNHKSYVDMLKHDSKKPHIDNVSSLYEIRKPWFGHNLHGKLTFKDQHGFWNYYRQNHRSYVDMLKHDSKKPHINNGFKEGKIVGEKRDHRHSGDGKAERTGHNHHNKAKTDMAS